MCPSPLVITLETAVPNSKIGEKKVRVWDFIKGLGLSQIQGGKLKKTPCIMFDLAKFF